MKVRAIKRGFFGGEYRKPGGEPFDCSKSEFSSNWMEVVRKNSKPLDLGGYVPLEIPGLMYKDKKD